MIGSAPPGVETVIHNSVEFEQQEDAQEDERLCGSILPAMAR